MKMCLAPCYKGCSDERYAEEAAAVQSFLSTRGDSQLVPLRTSRDQASANLEFESAAALHAQVQRVEAVRALAPEIVRPLSRLRAVLLQASAHPDEVAVFLFENGELRGPAAFSTLGMRIQNERSGSTSLFAQPMAIEPVPEEQGSGVSGQGSEKQGPRNQGTEGAEGHGPGIGEQRIEFDQSVSEEVLKGHDFSRATLGEKNVGALAPEGTAARIPRTLLESRLESALAELSASGAPPSATIRQGHLALLKRWYYRAEARREGEIFFPDAENRWPIRAILRGIGRVAAKALAPSLPRG